MIGEDFNKLSCQPGHSLFELDIGTDDYPEEFLWELVNSNNTILVNGGQYIAKYMFYHVSQCVSVPEDECATLQLLNNYYDGGTYYRVHWNGQIVEEDYHNSLIGKVELGNCNTTICQQNHSLFELIIQTDDYPDKFSWELVDSHNNILTVGGNYTDERQYHYYTECIPVTKYECITLHVFDSGGNGGTWYYGSTNSLDSITWKRLNSDYEETLIGDDCKS